jgi:peptide/nickel transport system ATP-binding protein
VRFMADRVMVMYLGKIAEIGDTEAVYGNGQHPYTRALLGSMLSMDPDKRSTQAPLVGDPPNPINPPAGCRFHTRCGHAAEVCRKLVPALVNHTGNQSVACHMSDPSSGHATSPRFVTEPV